MKKAVAIAGLAAALVTGAACESGGNGDSGGEHEVLINCYDPKTGKFVKRDDDCHDDGLTAVKPTPAHTSGGMQTAGPAKPSPLPRRTRRN